jgi:hypothetical protein
VDVQVGTEVDAASIFTCCVLLDLMQFNLFIFVFCCVGLIFFFSLVSLWLFIFRRPLSLIAKWTPIMLHLLGKYKEEEHLSPSPRQMLTYEQVLLRVL